MEDIMFCPKCGTDNDDTAKICKNCGEELDSVKNSSSNAPSNGGFMDKWNSFSNGKKAISIIGVCCIGLLIIGLIVGLGAPDKNTEKTTIRVDDLSINSAGYGMYDVSCTLIPDKDYSYLEAVVIYYDGSGAIIEKNPLVWNMNDVKKNQTIKVSGHGYVTGSNTPVKADVLFFDSAFSGNSDKAIYNQTVTF